MLTFLEAIEKSFSKFTGAIAKIGFLISSAAVFFMMIPIVVDVLLRSLSGIQIGHYIEDGIDKYSFDMADVLINTIGTISVQGVIEIEEIFMLFIVFLGLGWAKYSGGHIRVDLLFDFFPKKLQNVLIVFQSVIMIVFSTLMGKYIYGTAMEKMEYFETTADLFLPLWPVYMVAVIGCAVLVLCIIRQLLEYTIKCIEDKNTLACLAAYVGAALFMYAPFAMRSSFFASSPAALGGVVVLVLMVLLFIRMPIGFSMGVCGIAGMLVIKATPDMAFSALGSGPTATALSFVMTVVPMFVLMGEIALYSGISTEMFNTASIWLGRLPGGLAVSAVAGCAGFAAICGDSLATAMTMTSVALPSMKKHKYNEGLACATLAAGGTLGILIPPSMGFIMYAIVTEESIGRLFIAGIVPGLALALIFATMLITIALKWPHMAPRGDVHTWGEKFVSLTGILPMVGLVVLIIGGMMMGFFSPTEGGAVGAFGTWMYALARRRISFKEFIDALKSTAGMTTRLMMILIGVGILNYFLADTRLPFILADWVLSVGAGKYTVFMMIVMLYVVLGCLMNVIPMILLTLPALFPTVVSLGFDPIWFGVVTVILMEMGQITPPMGIVVFAIAGMPGTPPMAQIFKFILPFVFCMLGLVAVMLFVPEIALWLPNMLF